MCCISFRHLPGSITHCAPHARGFHNPVVVTDDTDGHEVIRFQEQGRALGAGLACSGNPDHRHMAITAQGFPRELADLAISMSVTDREDGRARHMYDAVPPAWVLSWNAQHEYHRYRDQRIKTRAARRRTDTRARLSAIRRGNLTHQIQRPGWDATTPVNAGL